MYREREKTSTNPLLSENRFSAQDIAIEGEPMSIQGTVNKIFILFLFLAVGAYLSISAMLAGSQNTMPMIIGGSVIGFLLVLATCFNIRIAKYTAIPYAVCEGLAIGAISAYFEAQWHGIVLNAVLGTFASMFVMLMLYKARLIQYTQKFQAVMLTAILSIAAIYIIQFIAMFFGRGIPLIWEAGPVGIAFSAIVVVIASLSLIQDFFFIENATNNYLSKDYEWYGAMGLMVTLIWLYMEILRLLAKLNSRR